MLQPKFHKRYYEYILYHSENAFMFAGFSKVGTRNKYAQVSDFSPYDSQILANMFTKVVNEGGLGTVLDAVYFLDNEFKQHIMENIRKDYLVHISRLFSANFEITRGRSRSMQDKKYEPELNYFLSLEGLPYTLQYPEIFICVINLILMTDRDEKLAELLNYEFAASSKCSTYTSLGTLFKLFLVSCVSSEYMLITLILIIHCTKKMTNRLFGSICEWATRAYSDKSDPAMLDNVKFLWNVLYGSETFGRFQETLSERGLYDARYADLYEKMYWNYVRREKALHQDDIKRGEKLFRDSP